MRRCIDGTIRVIREVVEQSYLRAVETVECTKDAIWWLALREPARRTG